MPNTSVVTDQSGRVTAIVINNTRYSLEAIVMLQTNTINLEDHEAAITLWKETAGYALNGQEEERRKRLDVEAKLEQYAQRLDDADQSIKAYLDEVSGVLGDAQMYEKVNRKIISYARDYVMIGTETAWNGLMQAVYEYNELRHHNGR